MNTKHDKVRTGPRTSQPAKARNIKWDLRLYVAGQTPKAATALKNLKVLCEEQLKGKYHIQVIDLLKNPRQSISSSSQQTCLPRLFIAFAVI